MTITALPGLITTNRAAPPGASSVMASNDPVITGSAVTLTEVSGVPIRPDEVVFDAGLSTPPAEGSTITWSLSGDDAGLFRIDDDGNVTFNFDRELNHVITPVYHFTVEVQFTSEGVMTRATRDVTVAVVAKVYKYETGNNGAVLAEYEFTTNGEYVRTSPQPGSVEFSHVKDTLVLDEHTPDFSAGGLSRPLSLGNGEDTYLVTSGFDGKVTIQDLTGSNQLVFDADVVIASVGSSGTASDTPFRDLVITLANGGVITMDSAYGKMNSTTPHTHVIFIKGETSAALEPDAFKTSYAEGYTGAPVFSPVIPPLSIIENVDGSGQAVTVGTIAAEGASGYTLTATVNGEASSDFAISASGVITYSGAGFDAEASPTITLTITARNDLGSTDQVVGVTVADANDVAPVITATPEVLVAGDSMTTEEAVLTPTLTTDVDTGNTVTWSLSGADADLFTIDDESGVVTFASETTPAYLTTPYYQFTVEAEVVNNGLTTSSSLDVIVTLDTTIIRYNDEGVQATYRDTGTGLVPVAPLPPSAGLKNDIIILDENTPDIKPTEQNGYDFLDLEDGNDAYIVTADFNSDITIRDTQGINRLIFRDDVEIKTVEIEEDSKLIGGFTEGSGFTKLVIALNNGGVIRVEAIYNRDGSEVIQTEDHTHEISIDGTDSEGAPLTPENFKATYSNGHNARPVFAALPQDLTIDENQGGTSTDPVYIATVSASPVDSFAITAMIGQEAVVGFGITAGGRITYIGDGFDAEGTTSLITLTVTATNSSGSTKATLNLAINDLVDVAPVFGANNDTTVEVTVDEGTTQGQTFEDITPDVEGNEVQFFLVESHDHALFTLNGPILRFNQPPDADAAGANSSFTVIIMATEGSGENSRSSTQTVTVTINDINDEAPLLLTTPATLPEGVEVGAGAAIFTPQLRTDLGTGDTMEWSIMRVDEDDSSLFDIDGSSGALSFKDDTTPDHEVQAFYSVMVQAAVTNGGNTVRETFILTINVEDQVDITPSLAAVDTVAINEGTTQVK
ncbi:MAG: hypothetical protein J4F41_09045, partial [Alphaproteobacteria bacterium]|nr:hypothetical protein [Alphaproteobacteria bacterium]